MNTVRSFWVGWGSLCVAGGGAYYFAKKEINADRAARYEAEQKKKQQQQLLQYEDSQNRSSTSANGGPARSDHSGSPSQESTLDPAATRHAPDTEGQRVREKSKYETGDPFRSKKGDRFS